MTDDTQEKAVQAGQVGDEKWLNDITDKVRIALCNAGHPSAHKDKSAEIDAIDDVCATHWRMGKAIMPVVLEFGNDCARKAFAKIGAVEAYDAVYELNQARAEATRLASTLEGVLIDVRHTRKGLGRIIEGVEK